MAGSLNKVQLIGNLGRDPEVRSFPNGGRVVNLRIATSETWKDKQTGERRERTEWHSVSIFNEAVGRIAEQYLRKGSKVYLEGSLETRKWTDQEGKERYTTEVVLRPYNGTLTLLDGRREGSGEGSQGYTPNQGQGQQGGYAPRQPASGAPSGGYSPNGGGQPNAGRPGGGASPYPGGYNSGPGGMDDDIPF